MIHITTCLLVVAFFQAAAAKMTCLKWGMISPVVGLVCHFAPDKYAETAQMVSQVVQQTVDSAENLADFAVEHSDVELAFKMYESDHPSEVLGQNLKDWGEFSIGFGKELANTALSLVEMNYWFDVAICHIKAANKALATSDNSDAVSADGDHDSPYPSEEEFEHLGDPDFETWLKEMEQGELYVRSLRRPSKRARQLSHDESQVISQNCLNPATAMLARPKGFNITDPSEKAGGTFADIALMFVPTPITEERVGAEVGEELFDLAIPGSEEKTTIFKKVDGSDEARHFGSASEAKVVRSKLKDQEWFEENCFFCTPPGAIAARSRRSARLHRRGAAMSACCRPGVVDSESIPDEDIERPTLGPDDPVPPEGLPHFDSEDYVHVGESDLTPPRDFVHRDLSIDDDISSLKSDLLDFNSGVVKWSTELTDLMSSDQALAKFRSVFENPDDPLFDLLQVDHRELEDGHRLASYSQNWIGDPDPALKPYQVFVQKAIDDCIETIRKLKGWDQEFIDEHLAEDPPTIGSNVELFYTSPGKRALTGTDPRGLHVDNTIMSFGIADREGLIVKNDVDNTFSRIRIDRNSFQLLKGNQWDPIQYMGTGGTPINAATKHSVFGSDMARDGRMSMIVHINFPYLIIGKPN